MPGCRDTNAQRFSTLNQHGRQWNDECGGMLRVKQCLGLNDQNRSCLARLSTPFRIEINQPHFSTITHLGAVRWRQIRD